MKLKVLVSLIILFITGCDYYDDRLIICNKSSSNIYVAFSRDTVMDLGESKTLSWSDNFVNRNSKKNFLLIGSKKAWEFDVKENFNQQLHIFIFLEDTLKKYDAKATIKMRKYERRIDVGLEKLEAENWEILFE